MKLWESGPYSEWNDCVCRIFMTPFDGQLFACNPMPQRQPLLANVVIHLSQNKTQAPGYRYTLGWWYCESLDFSWNGLDNSAALVWTDTAIPCLQSPNINCNNSCVCAVKQESFASMPSSRMHATGYGGGPHMLSMCHAMLLHQMLHSPDNNCSFFPELQTSFVLSYTSLLLWVHHCHLCCLKSWFFSDELKQWTTRNEGEHHLI